MRVYCVTEAPTVPATLTMSIDENSATDTVVGSVGSSAADVDSDAILAYSITSYGDYGDGMFSIDVSSGTIKVASATLNYESVTVYTLGIVITDNGGLTCSTTVTVCPLSACCDAGILCVVQSDGLH